MNRLNYLQAMQKQDNPENDLGKALYRVTQLEAEIERLNKALEQVKRLIEGRYVHPELAAWLKENR